MEDKKNKQQAHYSKIDLPMPYSKDRFPDVIEMSPKLEHHSQPNTYASISSSIPWITLLYSA